MTDPRWDDPERWEVVPNVVVFDEHERKSEDGKGKVRAVKVTRKDLEETAANNNERDGKGQPCPLTIGHTDPRDAEKDQPEIVGYARKWRVVYSKRLQRWVLVCAYYLRRERAKEAREYPRVSVEYWPESKMIDPLALLKRTPERDLGQWTYHRRAKSGETVIRYARDAGMADAHDEPDGDEGRDGDPTDMVPGKGKHPEDWEHEPPDGVEPEFHGKVMKCMRQGFHPLFKEHMKDHPEQHVKEADETEVAGTGGTDSTAHKTAAYRKRAPSVAEQQYAKELEELRKEIAGERRSRRTVERRSDLEKLVAQGVMLDVDEELADVVDMDQARYEKHLDKIAVRYGRDITLARSVSVDATPSRSAGDPSEVTREDLAVAEAYMRDHPGCEWKEAEEHAIKNRKRGRAVTR